MQRMVGTRAAGRTGAIRAVAAAALVATPFVFAFRSGAYFDQSRLWAGVVVAAVLLLTAIAVPRPLPSTTAGRLALAGVWGLTAWTAASISWAPMEGPAFHDTQRLLVYSLALTAGAALLRPRALTRALEPVMAAGCVVVIGYGLAGRLLPGIVHESSGLSAAGRLDQPLTYWNAVGAVAAIGLVLCARIGGDGERPRWARAAAAAACVPLGMGLYITYSRGALAAAATGLLVLLALAPSRPQLRTGAIAVAAAGLGAAAAAPFPAVASLGHGSRTSQGAASLALLLVLAAAAGLVQARFARLEADGRLSTAPVRLRGLRTAAVVGACAVIALFVAATSAGERRSASRTAATGAVPSRLTSFRSHRYAYWNVALGAFADHPLDGLGSGNFSVRWLRKRHFREAVMDAHSLYLETAAELGLPGLLALAALFAGVVLAARDVMRSDAVLGAGLAAGSAAWAAQAGVDWLWEMPAVTLIALTLAAGLLASAEAGARPEPPG